MIVQSLPAMIKKSNYIRGNCNRKSHICLSYKNTYFMQVLHQQPAGLGVGVAHCRPLYPRGSIWKQGGPWVPAASRLCPAREPPTTRTADLDLALRRQRETWRRAPHIECAVHRQDPIHCKNPADSASSEMWRQAVNINAIHVHFYCNDRQERLL